MEELKIEDVEKLVNEYKTTYKEGFTNTEIDIIINKYDNINELYFHKAKFGDTVMKIGDDYITYHCDMISCIKCAIERRDKTFEEWD